MSDPKQPPVRSVDDDSSNYEVGYKRPPRCTRFQKGRSGNSKGRPKGSKNLSTLIEQELNQRITVSENGERRQITKKQAVAKQLVNKAVSGDPKAIPILLQEERVQRDSASASSASSFTMTPDDDAVVENLLARIRGAQPEPGARELGGERAPALGEEPDGSSEAEDETR